MSPTPAHQAATSMPSRKRCGSRSRYQRSLKVPGSPSSMLTAIRRGSGPGGGGGPLAPPREAGAAEAAQAGVLHGLGELLAGALAREAIADQLVAAELPVLVEADV